MKSVHFTSTPSKAIYVHLPEAPESNPQDAPILPSFFVLLKMRTGSLVNSGYIEIADAVLGQVRLLEEKLQVSDPGEFAAKHYVRLRAIFFDDKNGAMSLHVDYLHDQKTAPLQTVEAIKKALYDGVGDDIFEGQVPNVAVTIRKVSVHSDYFAPDHDEFYTDELRQAIYW